MMLLAQQPQVMELQVLNPLQDILLAAVQLLVLPLLQQQVEPEVEVQ
tara:strand:+ start:417 stop:557 length:141 start_codon:yes stop_codon:yes gene_type:complete